MGKRGPGAQRHKKTSSEVSPQRKAARAVSRPDQSNFYQPPLFEMEFPSPAPPMRAAHPWDKEGMPPEERMLAFLRTLPIVSGLKAGTTLELLEFQERFVRGIYGPVDDEGHRLVQLAALSVARGNGKSAIVAGLSLGHLLGPMMEPYGECYSAALDRDHAGVLFRMACSYISEVPWMAERVNIKDWHKEIIDEESGSIWRALTSDARKAHGLAPSFWVADEVAQWKSRELWDNLATGMGKRAQALGVTISTQAKDDLHFFSEMLDAEPDPSVYIQLHTAPVGCELHDREAWKAANPALGTFLNEKQLAKAAERAARSPSFGSSFRLLNLNQRVSTDDRFILQVDWEANAEPFDASELEGEPCFGGLDLSSTRDLTALSLWFPNSGRLLSWHWITRDTMEERIHRDRVPYDRWAEADWIEVTAGRATDRAAIARRIAHLMQLYDVRSIAFDRYRIEDLLKILEDEDIDLPMIEFATVFKTYAAACDAFETALLERRMQHNGNPVLRWQAGNVVVEKDHAGNRRPAKNKSIARIDGIVTAMMACWAAGQGKEQEASDGGSLFWL